jgi:hypothetical protein
MITIICIHLDHINHCKLSVTVAPNKQQIGPSECVRQRLALHTLVENVVSTINGKNLSFFLSSHPVTFLPEGIVLGIFR